MTLLAVEVSPDATAFCSDLNSFEKLPGPVVLAPVLSAELVEVDDEDEGGRWAKIPESSLWAVAVSPDCKAVLMEFSAFTIGFADDPGGVGGWLAVV
jgi:hypothetical protein